MTSTAAPAPVGQIVALHVNRRLLAAGEIAGPLFVTVSGAGVLTRDGFDLSRHALSWLSLGSAGWVQIAAFVGSGLLTIAFAVGLRRVLRPGRAARFGPLLVGAYGVGLVASGVFVVDPCGGFPIGAPADCLGAMSWHFQLHNAVSMAAFLALTAATVVLARRHLADGRRGAAAYDLVTAVVVLALFAYPSFDGITWRLALATAVMSAWTTVLARGLRAGS